MASNLAQGQWIGQALEDARALLEQTIQSDRHIEDIAASVDLFLASLRQGGKILTCGNGGSHCDALHFAEELTGRFRKERPPLAALSLGEATHLSCVGNDYGFEYVYSRAVEALAKPQDCILVISTSGRSPNCLRAAQAAHERGAKVVGLLGYDGGSLLSLCDAAVVIPGSTSDRIQEMHIKVIHIWVELIERALFPQNYGANASA